MQDGELGRLLALAEQPPPPVMEELEALRRRKAAQLRARGGRLQEGLAVRLCVGALVDEVRGTGDGRGEALELGDQVVEAFGIEEVVVAMRTHHVGGGGAQDGGRGVGAPDVLLVFFECEEAADARRQLLGGDVWVQIGDRRRLVPVRSALPHLDCRTVEVVIYRLPYEFAREGAVEAILEDAGYGPDRVSVQAVFLGDLPAVGGRVRRMGNIEVIVALVRAPSDDPILRRLGRTFYAGWGVTADIRVRAWRGQRDPLVLPPSAGGGAGPVPPPPPPPPRPGPQPRVGEGRDSAQVSPPPPPRAGAQPRVGEGRGSAQVPPPPPPPPGASRARGQGCQQGGSVSPPRAAMTGPGAAREQRPSGGAGVAGASGPQPMEVGVHVPDCSLAESCVSFLEDRVEGISHETIQAVVASVAGQHSSAWAGCAWGTTVPEWCAAAMVDEVRARCPSAVVTLPARLERAASPPPVGDTGPRGTQVLEPREWPEPSGSAGVGGGGAPSGRAATGAGTGVWGRGAASILRLHSRSLPGEGGGLSAAQGGALPRRNPPRAARGQPVAYPSLGTSSPRRVAAGARS
jgi:hypothetical protein